MLVDRSVVLAFAFGLLAGSAWAHGGQDHGGGFPSSGSSSSDGGSDPWPFGHKTNEASEAVRMDLREVVSERESAVERHASASELVVLDRKLAQARLRLSIAEKREERDQLRQRGEADGSAKIEKQVDALKRKLSQLDAKPR